MTTPYVSGTVSVTAGTAVVTGVGTGWATALIAGGMFGLDSANGNPVPIASIDSDTQLTLAKPWRGTTAATQAYWIIRDTAYGQQTVTNATALAQIINELRSASLASFAGLSPEADRLAYFTGGSSAALTALTANARALLNLSGSAGAGRVPVFTGPNGAAARDIVGSVSQSGGVPTGGIIERGSNANGDYVRFADGTQICTNALTGSSSAGVSVTWTYPVSFATVTGLSLSVTPFSGSTTYVRSGQVSGRSSSSMDFYAWAVPVSGGASLGSAVTHQLLAVGRWF